MTETRSTCPYCGVGCGVIIESQGEQITGVRGDPEHPANFGRLCTKGSTLHQTAARPITLQARLLQPARRPARGEAPRPMSWDGALDMATDRFHRIIAAHGPDAVGFYISGQLLTEDYYVFNKLAKGLIGTNNVDTNSRLCMSSAVAGYKATLGADAPPACYEDFDHATTLFITGSNTAWAHPIAYRRIEDAKRARPAMKMIVVDPRRTETAEAADLHLPILPGTDVALYHGMLHLMLWEGLVDMAYVNAHTEGFEALRNRVRDFTPKEVARTCGIDEGALLQAARWFGEAGGRTLSLYCQGLNQSSSGTAKNAALINLHLATGQIGKRGAGPFSLTGQPNAMGGREVGGMANLLGGHRDLANAAHRAEVARLWNVAEVPATPGKTAVEMFEAAADGEIRALWISCTNPAQSMPDQTTVRRALERAEFVVVQEAFGTTTTCEYADLLLPATTWGEKDGTVTNSERRISRVRPTSRAAWNSDCARASPASFPTTRPSRCGTSTARAPAAETSTSPA
jgi:assimilatory nitrate reductase catalytic subunit